MPKGVYIRRNRKQAVSTEQRIISTDTIRMDALERLSNVSIFQSRFLGDPVIVRSGVLIGRGETVRAALDDLVRHE